MIATEKAPITMATKPMIIIDWLLPTIGNRTKLISEPMICGMQTAMLNNPSYAPSFSPCKEEVRIVNGRVLIVKLPIP